MNKWRHIVGGRRAMLPAAIAGVISLAITACSNSSASSPTPSLSGTPIVLGSVGTFSVPGESVGTGPAPIEAWADWVNAHGGINGHPVQVIVKDDQANQAAAVSDVEQLVQQDHVVAFVANEDGSLTGGYAAYLDQHKIPVLGGSIYTPIWTTDPMFFPQGVTPTESEQAAVTYAKQAGYTKVGSLACSEAVQCSAANALFQSLTTANGLDDTYSAVVSSTLPDYTANCLAAKSAGVQIMQLVIPTATEGVNVADDCSRQNYHPAWILPEEAIGPGYLASPSLNSAYNFSGTQPWYSTDPSMADFHAAMSQYTKINFKTVEEPLLAPDAWASGLMFQRAVALSGVQGLPTSADILAGLSKFNNETLGGVTGPLTFTNPTNKVANCFFVTEIKNQQFVEGNNNKYLCNPS